MQRLLLSLGDIKRKTNQFLRSRSRHWNGGNKTQSRGQGSLVLRAQKASSSMSFPLIKCHLARAKAFFSGSLEAVAAFLHDAGRGHWSGSLTVPVRVQAQLGGPNTIPDSPSGLH